MSDPMETPRDKRIRLMGDKTQYASSTAVQTAALTWAIVEQTDALTEANRIASAQLEADKAAVEATRQLRAEQRLANLIAFYNTPTPMFPAGVRDQLAAALGITSIAPAPAPIDPGAETGPSPERPLRAPIPLHREPEFEADFS